MNARAKTWMLYAVIVGLLVIGVSMCAHTAATCDGTVVRGLWRYECIEERP
jgi:hypothetical protein